MVLPPYAPDYSGVCSALFELGGLVVIHDGGGCTGNYTGFDEPRWYGSKSAIFCSGLREMDAVLGADDLLIRKIKAACQELSPRFVAILGSPVPMLIGTDMTGIAAELEDELQLPCFGMATNGLKVYPLGIGMAEKAMADRYLRDPERTRPGTLNILGMTPLDFACRGNAEQLQELLASWGYEVLASFDMGNSLERIASAGEAQVNLVVSQGGLPLARWMERRYQIPYVAGLAMGQTGQTLLRELLDRTAQDGVSRTMGRTAAEAPRILFAGEQLQGNAFRAARERKTGRSDVCVAGVFGPDAALMAPGDLSLPEEGDLLREIRSGKYEVVIGDPLMKGLLRQEEAVDFREFPHVAISSKLYWDHAPQFCGAEMEALLDL